MSDSYCYPGSDDVLINALDIRDRQQLAWIEHEMAVMLAPAALSYAEAEPTLASQTLQGIHYLLFGELYDWAGKLRTVPLQKGESTFADPQRVQSTWLDDLLRTFNTAADRASGQYEFGRILVELWGRLNWLHPFREGNGRATQIFLQAIAHRHGYDIDWSMVERHNELTAAESAMREDFAPYRAILHRALTPWSQQRPPDEYFSQR